MFVLRNQQIDVMTRPFREASERRLCAHLERFFPRQCNTLGDERLVESVRYGIERARVYGISSERDCAKYLNVAFTLGRDFDSSPEYSWAEEILNLKSRPRERMGRVVEKALEVAGESRGFFAEQGASAEEPALRVWQRPFDEERQEAWSETMGRLISYYTREAVFFRWDDTRDLESSAHLEAIAGVVRRTPTVRHWLPTRARQLVQQFLVDHAEGFPANLLVRISAETADSAASTVADLPTSTEHASAPPRGSACPGHCPESSCGECRICWDPRVSNVSFPRGRWATRQESAAA